MLIRDGSDGNFLININNVLSLDFVSLEVAVDLEDSDNDCHHSANSLCKTRNTTIQDETPLFTEPVENRYALCKPKDHLNGAYIIFFLLGTSSLLPLNFIMTAKHYWMYKLQNCSEQISPAERRDLDVRVSMACLCVNFVG